MPVRECVWVCVFECARDDAPPGVNQITDFVFYFIYDSVDNVSWAKHAFNAERSAHTYIESAVVMHSMSVHSTVVGIARASFLKWVYYNTHTHPYIISKFDWMDVHG